MAANYRRRSFAESVQAPVGGLNDRDSISIMPKSDAKQLENAFPNTSSVDVRGGCVEYATGFGATGESLLGYNGIATAKMFAASNGSIYDITSGGAIGAAVASSMSNNRWDHVNFGGAAGNFLVAVNGANLPQFYNGSTWTASGTGYATAITGVSASSFSQVNVWKNRLFFVEKDTLRCWYLGTQAIGGAASSLDFAGVAKLGGKLIATATVSSSAGQQLDDYFVAITSEGECLVYQGTDPASASTFALVGNYRIGRPIANGLDNNGGRFLCRVSSQVIAITIDGFVNLQDAVNSDVQTQRLMINDKIVNSVSKDTSLYKGNFGWQVVLMPIKNRVFINVPTTQGSSSRQWVMNTITGAWCKYTGWDATCFLYWQDNLYAFIGNKVYRMEVESSNDFVSGSSTGTSIKGEVETAYQYFGGRNQQKSYKMVRTLFYGSANIQPGVSVNVDFKSLQNPSVANVSTSSGAKWGIAKWGVDKWGGGNIYSQYWRSVNGIGYCASLRMSLNCDSQICQFQAWDIIYERGGLM